MSDTSTTRMLDMYMEDASAPGFLSTFFRTPPKNFHRSEKVEIDVLRGEPRLAIPVPSVSSDPRRHESSKYVNKGFTPPVYDLQASLSAFSGLKRRPGRDPFEDPDFLADVAEEAMREARELEMMIRRSVEYQCARVFQAGAFTLVDETGATIYTIDFEAKTTHLATVGTTWALDGLTGAPLDDLAALAAVVRRDGKKNPDTLIFGTSAAQRFLANTQVRAQLDNRRMEIGLIQPAARAGATSMGFIWIGQYRFELWTYDDEYIDPVTGNSTPYIDTDNVVMLSSGGRLDLTFGELPMFAPPEARAAQILPPRMSSPALGLDLSTNAWVSPDGKHLHFSCGTRALAIPTAIDTFARLNVTT